MATIVVRSRRAPSAEAARGALAGPRVSVRAVLISFPVGDDRRRAPSLLVQHAGWQAGSLPVCEGRYSGVCCSQRVERS